jgi:hypothetical protein
LTYLGKTKESSHSGQRQFTRSKAPEMHILPVNKMKLACQAQTAGVLPPSEVCLQSLKFQPDFTWHYGGEKIGLPPSHHSQAASTNGGGSFPSLLQQKEATR